MRSRLEDAFERWSGFVSSWRRAIIVLALAVTALCATQIPRIEIETSTESFLFEDDPGRIAYDELREQFGRDQTLLVVLEPPSVFDPGFLSDLRDLHEAIENEVPHVVRVTSLVDVRSVEGRDDRLIVGNLIEEIPTSSEAIEALRRRVMASPTYRNNFISPDGRTTAIVVETDAFTSEADDADPLGGFDERRDASASGDSARSFLTPEEDAAIVEAIQSVTSRFAGRDVVIRIAGSPMVTYELTRAMMRQLPIFLSGSFLVVALSMWLLFRRATPCIISMFVVGLSVTATMGTLGLLGIPFSLLTQILPSFMLAVGIGYSVHMFAIFLQRLDAGHDRDAALVGALRHTGPPILMTAVTTLAGLSSFLVATLAPARDFGIAGILGVAWTLLFNMTLLPALVCSMSIERRTSHDGRIATSRALIAIGTTAARHPWKVLVGSVLLAFSSAASLQFVTVSNDPIKYLAPESPYRIASEWVDERFGGAGSIEILLGTETENGLFDPDAMNRIDALDGYVADYEFEGLRLSEPTSLLDILKESHQALNDNDPGFYVVPQDRGLIAQQFLLFENSGADDLERLVDSGFQRARYSIRTRIADGNLTSRMLRAMRDELPAVLGPDIEYVITGASALISRTVEATTTSLVRTYAMALVVITPLMIVLIGSLRVGLVSMVPNLLPILVTLGAMPLLETPLDIFTMMVGCIAIGLAVDDTLHFIHGFRVRLAAHANPHLAIEETLATTGRALLYTSIVLSMGFLVLTFSSMANLRAMGALTALAIAGAFILDILVTPALLVLVTPRRARSDSNPRSSDSAKLGYPLRRKALPSLGGAPTT